MVVLVIGLVALTFDPAMNLADFTFGLVMGLIGPLMDFIDLIMMYLRN